MNVSEAPKGQDFWTRFEPEYRAIQENFVTNRNLLRAIAIVTHDSTLSRLNLPTREVTDPERDPFTNFQKIIDTCFGANGYLNDQSPEKIAQDKQLITRAYILAEWVHREGKRDSGRPYIEHPIALVVGWNDPQQGGQVPGLLGLKVTAETIAAALLHDVIEDTPITKDIIKDFIAAKVSETVDTLTKVRKSQNMLGGEEIFENDREETILKIIRALISDPDAIKIKIYDRMHNMATLHDLRNDDGEIDRAKQVNYAADTASIYVRLAQMMGLTWEAKWLAEQCASFTDPAVYQDRLYGQIKHRMHKMYRKVNPEKLSVKIQAFLQTDIPMSLAGVETVTVKIPQPHEMLGELNGRRELTPEDFFLNMQIVISDESYLDQRLREKFPDQYATDPLFGFRPRARQVVSDLLISPDFVEDKEVVLDGNGGETARFTSNLKYITPQRTIPIHLEIISHSQLAYELGSLAYLSAQGMIYRDPLEHEFMHEELYAAALERHNALREKYQLIERFKELTIEQKGRLIQEFLTSLSQETMNIVGVDREGKRRLTPIVLGSTVADYMAQKLLRHLVHGVETTVNGEPVALDRVLQEGDVIHCDTSDSEQVVDLESFITALAQDRERTLPFVAEMLDRIAQGKQEDESDEVAGNVQQQLANRGFEKIRARMPFFGTFTLDRISGLFPDEDPMTFFYHCGLEFALPKVDGSKYSTEQFEVLIKKLERYWKNLNILAVQVVDTSGVFEELSREISDHNMSILHSDQRIVLDATQNTHKRIWLLLRFGEEVSMEHIKDAARSIRELSDDRILSVRSFSTSREMERELGITA